MTYSLINPRNKNLSTLSNNELHDLLLYSLTPITSFGGSNKTIKLKVNNNGNIKTLKVKVVKDDANMIYDEFLICPNCGARKRTLYYLTGEVKCSICWGESRPGNWECKRKDFKLLELCSKWNKINKFSEDELYNRQYSINSYINTIIDLCKLPEDLEGSISMLERSFNKINMPPNPFHLMNESRR